MSGQVCEEMRLLVQAELDGELSPAEAARVVAHAASCPECAALRDRLLALSGAVRRAAPYQPAPAALRQRVTAAVTPRHGTRATPRRLPMRSTAWFGGGFALAACLALLLVLPRGGGLADDVVAAHIRALQPGHTMDVVSTDQHTVKPWFDGRLPFAPPVRDFAAQGFPLAGGRLDYLAGHPVAALVYHRRQHIIDVFVWPATGAAAIRAASGAHDGYQYRRWEQDGMVLWAVSDVGAAELDEFVRLWGGG